MLTNLSLFSGAGGLDLGARLVGGFKTVAYVEYDRYAQGVLMSRMRSGDLDDAPIFEDVRTFDGRSLRESIDVVSGGFPCQDLSVAGKQKGIIEGERSGLWREYFRIICEVRPNFVLVENVAGFLMGGAIGVALRDLAAIGYDAEWSCLSASQVGAPHKRERVWLIAYPHGFGRDGVDKDEKNICARVIAESSKTWGNVPHDISLPMDEYEADPVPGVLRMDDGMAEAMDGVRLCGNGVVPQQSATAWQTIKDLAGVT
jgi:DNA (cytosine-5)-methyltransferase 1